MIFVVAIDPESVRALIDQGELGEDQLLGLFEALLQNCLLAETVETWRIGIELKESIKSIKDPGIKMRVNALLETLGSPSKNRFVEAIYGYENNWETSISEIIATQGENSELDAVICEKPNELSKVEFVSALRFNASNFARTRSRSACAVVYSPGTRIADDLLKEVFGRLVRHADSIEIFDKQAGKDFGPNYFEAIPHWCRFLRSVNRPIKLRIHTTKSQAKGIQSKFEDELSDSMVRVSVTGHSEDEQPHERFFRACGFTLEIGRGLDLFDRNGTCRDIKIGLSDHGSFEKNWKRLSG